MPSDHAAIRCQHGFKRSCRLFRADWVCSRDWLLGECSFLSCLRGTCRTPCLLRWVLYVSGVFDHLSTSCCRVVSRPLCPGTVCWLRRPRCSEQGNAPRPPQIVGHWVLDTRCRPEFVAGCLTVECVRVSLPSGSEWGCFWQPSF